MDFQQLKSNLLPYTREIIANLIPGGRIVGQEYVAGSILGGLGDSFKFNLTKALGADFATTEKYDIISLYAACRNVTQTEAAKQLSDKYFPVIAVPMKHYKLGDPVKTWTYTDRHGAPLFYVARYNTAEGKTFLPWSMVEGKLTSKGYPPPRPLYNLPDVYEFTGKPILITEGEKACDAAKIITQGVYVCVTWANGAQSINKTDWKSIHSRKVLLWPDADKPGVEAMDRIATLLSEHCPEIKILNTDGLSDGWDAADALESGFSWQSWKEWALKRVSVYQHPKTPDIIEKTTPESKPAVTINAVQINTQDDPGQISGSLTAMWLKMGLALSSQGSPICNLDNIYRTLETYPELMKLSWYDEFHQKIFTQYNGKRREWSDDDDLNITLFVQRNLGIRRISDDIIHKAVRTYANNNRRNEPQDWIKSLVWDNKPRVETFLIDCAGSPDNDYIRCVSRNFWVSMVARVFNPGCKVDTMIILEGKQGSKKSTLLETIAGSWHASIKESIDSKDFFMAFQGKLILEFADLSSFHKSEINRLKHIITDRFDRYRSPYDRTSKDHPRQCIFAGTTNDSIYLGDDTGGRRFWPVVTNNLDIPLLIDNRDNLFAEAYHLFLSGSTWHEVPESASQEQESRRKIDPWESKIERYIQGHINITTDQILSDFLHIDIAKQTIYDEMRVGKILKRLGYVRTRPIIQGIRTYVYNLQKQEDEW